MPIMMEFMMTEEIKMLNNETFADDTGVFDLQSHLVGLRMEALRLAAKTFDPDSEINILDLMGVARTLLNYVVTGQIPQEVSHDPAVEPAAARAD